MWKTKLEDNEITVCEASRKNLHFEGLWPRRGEEINPGKLYYLRIVIFCLITAFSAFFVLFHLAIVLIKNLDVPISENLAVSVAIIGVYYMTFTFLLKRSEIMKLIVDLSDFSNFGKPPNYQQEHKKVSLLANLYFLYTIPAGSFYGIYRYLNQSECKEFHLKYPHKLCGFMSDLWVPININSVFTYWMFYLLTFCGLIWLFTPAVIVITFCFELTKNVILRINHLKEMISQCFEVNSYYVAKMKLKRCIQYHSEILEFASRLDNCFSNTLFAHLVLTSIVCATLENQFIKGDRFCSSLHIAGWIFSLLIACISGQFILTANDTIAEALWLSNWYESDIRLRKDFLFFLIRSQKTLKLTAGPFGILSYALFVSVMKMSYSIFCILSP